MPEPLAITFSKITPKLKPPDFLLVTVFQNAPSPFNITCFDFLQLVHYPYHNFVISSHVEIIIVVETLNVLVLAGIELIFFPVAAVFWISYEKNVDSTDAFSCCYHIKDFFQSLRFS